MTNQSSIPIIIDNGTGSIKAGFASDDDPSCVFPSVVGRPKVADTGDQFYVGSNAQTRRDILSLCHPIDYGVTAKWNEIETLWRYAFEQLKVTFDEHPVLMTENPNNPRSFREKMAQIVFEEFNVPSFYIALQAVLSMYSAGRITGIVHCSGEGTSYTVPVYEGYAIQRIIPQSKVPGRDLTFHLMDKLNDQGHPFESLTSFQVADDIKKSLCYVSMEYETDVGNDKSGEVYRLPDGQSITIDQVTRFNIPEAIFQPALMNSSDMGVHEVISGTVRKCDPTIQKLLRHNVVIAEGNTLFPGFKDRLEKELGQLDGEKMYAVKANPYQGCAAWKGGVTLATLTTFKDICVTREEYNDYGPRFVHRKCF